MFTQRVMSEIRLNLDDKPLDSVPLNEWICAYWEGTPCREDVNCDQRVELSTLFSKYGGSSISHGTYSSYNMTWTLLL